MSQKNKQKKQRFKPKFHIKKDDEVIVLAGDEKGKRGKVLEMDYKKSRAIVEGLNIAKKHTKANTNAENAEGGILEKEVGIHISNLMLIDPKSGQPTRIGREERDGRRIRIAKKSGEVI